MTILLNARARRIFYPSFLFFIFFARRLDVSTLKMRDEIQADLVVDLLYSF